MSCNCIGTVFSAIKSMFTKTSSEEKKSGNLSGRTVSQTEAKPADEQLNQVVKEAISNLLAGKDPGPLTDEVKQKVEEGLKGIYVMILAGQVADSEAKNFEEAEKVATVALDTFTKQFVDGIAKHHGEDFPADKKEAITNDFKQSLGVAPRDLAVLGLLLRQQAPKEEPAAGQPQN